MQSMIYHLRSTVRDLAELVSECVDAINELRARPTVVNITVNVLVIGDAGQWEIVRPGELAGE